MARNLSYKDYWNMKPSEFEPGDVVEARLVLVVGHGGDYAVYVAPDATWDAERIAREGDKVTLTRGEAVGKSLFPSVADGRYYRR